MFQYLKIQKGASFETYMNEMLKLENQMCFPLYACAKEVVRRYTPLLEPLGLTYTQYIAMMVMWEHKSISVRDMGKLLFLDSGTLTPMLKKMEKAALKQFPTKMLRV